MRFYDRDKELKTLEGTHKVAFSKASQMTVVTGRRSIGKTELTLKSCEPPPTIYLIIDEFQEKHNYVDYSGHVLEAYFRDKLSEEHALEQIGSWWEGKRGKGEDTDQHEIDIVAIYFKEKRVLLAEVKRQRKNFDAAKFEHKVQLIKTKLFAKYKIDTACLTLEDM